MEGLHIEYIYRATEMQRVYKSKVGLEIIVPIMLALGVIIILMLTNPISWLGLISMAGLTAFIIHLFSTTYYTIIDTTLHVKCGFLYNRKIDILSIKKISETNDLTSSPALSLDRLEINYDMFDSILISPKEKSDFVHELISINPQIELSYKNKKDL